MTQTKYTIKEESYWTGSGCDCCNDTETIVYKVFDESGELVFTESGYLEDLYKQILLVEGIIIEFEEGEDSE